MILIEHRARIVAGAPNIFSFRVLAEIYVRLFAYLVVLTISQAAEAAAAAAPAKEAKAAAPAAKEEKKLHQSNDLLHIQALLRHTFLLSFPDFHYCLLKINRFKALEEK